MRRPIRTESRIEAIDWVKRVVGIMGSLSDLMRESLQQNHGRIHCFGDGVGLCVRWEATDLSGAWVRLVSLLRGGTHPRQADEVR